MTETDDDDDAGRHAPVSGVVPGDGNQSIGGQVDGNEVRDLVSSAVDRLYKPAADLHRDAEKKEPIFFCVHLF